MRKFFESNDDRIAEARVALICEKAWNKTLKKLPLQYRLDFAVCTSDRIGAEVRAYVEVKCKKMKYSTLVLSAKKVSEAAQLSKANRVRSFFVIKFDNDPVPIYTMIADSDGSIPEYLGDIEWGGRFATGRDGQDEEPVYMIPEINFKPVGWKKEVATA